MEIISKKEIICKLLTVKLSTYYRIYTIIDRYVFKLYYPLNSVSNFRDRDKAKLTLNLALIESIMYLIDQLAEDGKEECFEQDTGASFSKLDSIKSKFLSLLSLLGLKEDGLEEYIEMGEKYIRAENKIVRNKYKNISLQDIKEVVELRSSDVRLLHIIIINELNLKKNDDLINALWHLEVISEFENDLEDYKKDKLNENFNMIIMYENVYGNEAFCREIMGAISNHLKDLKDRLNQLTHEEKEVIENMLRKSMKKIITLILELGDAQDIISPASGNFMDSKVLSL
jgi:DNA-binding transcriptional MerR regulator